MLRFILLVFLVLTLADVSMAKTQKSFVPHAFSAEFVQEAKSAISDKVSKSNLDVKYQYPNNFYLKDNGNDPTIYVCNQKNVWIYKPPFIEGVNGELTIGSKSDQCYSKIFDSLKYGLNSNKTYKVKKISATNFELSFLKGAKAELGLEKLVLVLKNAKTSFDNINKLELYYEGEKGPVTLSLVSISKVKAFPKETFIFKVPKNTNVTRM